MDSTTILTQVLEASDRRRDERRNFLRVASQATVAAGGLSLLAACGSDNNVGSASPTPTPTPTPTSTTAVTDVDILNFALNLEYLEAQFYSYAVYGTGLPASQLTGVGTQGSVTGGRQVTFTDPVVAQYAREIASDEIAHVAFLRSALGSSAVAMPAINIDGSTTGAFTAAARAAGVVSQSANFDPYASDNNFLLGAFIFEDVGVSAYKGAAPLLSSKTYLDAAAGILAAEAYHAGLIRTVLYAKGFAGGTGTGSIFDQVRLISDARDSLDGSTDDDQGIAGADTSISNIVPTDSSGIAYSRTAANVLNIVYLTKSATVGGGFFPNGVNGFIKTSNGN